MLARSPLRSSVLRRSMAAVGAFGLAVLASGCSAASPTAPSATSRAASSAATATAAGAFASRPGSQDPASAGLQGVAAAIGHAYRLSAPTRFPGTCPDLSARLSQAFGTAMTYWQGDLPRGPEGCQYATVPSTAAGSMPQDRFWVNIGFLTGTTADQMQRGAHNPGSACPAVDVPRAAAQAALDRCARGDLDVVYDLYVPDTSGAGIWVLSTGAGTRYSGVPASDAMVTIADAAQSIYGG